MSKQQARSAFCGRIGCSYGKTADYCCDLWSGCTFYLPVISLQKKQPIFEEADSNKQKYHNEKIVENGETFDSKKEYKRYKELKLLEQVGEIQTLRRQVKFELIPAQYKDGKCLFKACSYYADFVYMQDGKQVVEDCKGMRTEVYKIKKKMMYHLYKILIYET